MYEQVIWIEEWAIAYASLETCRGETMQRVSICTAWEFVFLYQYINEDRWISFAYVHAMKMQIH
jgi:hypothetical protein